MTDATAIRRSIDATIADITMILSDPSVAALLPHEPGDREAVEIVRRIEVRAASHEEVVAAAGVEPA